MFENKNKNNRGILITGIHRSGSTWLGKMLALSKQVDYLGEPFGPPTWQYYFAYPLLNSWFYYLTSEDKKKRKEIISHGIRESFTVKDLIRHLQYSSEIKNFAGWIYRYLRFHFNRMRGVRPLIKDPTAFFSAEWLHHTFDLKVVIIIRHPAAFYGSMKRMNASKGWDIGLETWLLEQPELMRDYLSDFEDQIKSAKNGSLIEKSIVFWNIFHELIYQFSQKHPDWYIISHEKLSENPIEEISKIFTAVELEFSPAIAENIQQYTNKKNPTEINSGDIHKLNRNSQANIKSWKNRLSEEEVALIYQGTKKVASYFYGNESWE